MADSTKTLTSSSYDGRKNRVVFEQYKDVENNRSRIHWTFYSEGGNSNYYTTGPVTIRINGTQAYYCAQKGWSSYEFPAAKGSTSGDIYVNHSSDGRKTITVELTTAIYVDQTTTYSASWTLSTIPRASTVTCADGNIGSSTTININRASSSFTHTLTYSFSGLTGTIAIKTSNTSIGWTIPTSFYAKIPNTKSGQGTITCQTYNGSILIGTKSCTFNAFVVNSDPTITATVTDTNQDSIDATGDSNKLIRYVSDAKLVITATPKNSATISSVKVVNGSKSSTNTTSTINAVDSGTFNLSCVDSRGNTGIAKITKTIVNYIKPVIVSAQLTRASTTSNTINAVIQGQVFNGSFGTAINLYTLKFRYKLSTSSTWESYTTLSATLSGNNFIFSGTLGIDFDYTKSYDFQIVLTDTFFSNTKNVIVTRGLPIIDIGKDDVVFNGIIHAQGDRYIERGGGLDLHNSDIINCNSFYMNDEATEHEGINFLKQGGDKSNPEDYECLRGYRGNLRYDDTIISYSDTIQVYSNSRLEFNLDTAWGSVKVPFTHNRYTGNAFSLDITNKRVICNKSGVIDIIASFNWLASTSPQSDYAIHIYKNNAFQSSVGYVSGTGDNYKKIDGNLFGIVVEAGDYIDMRIMCGATGTIKSFEGAGTSLILRYRRA